MTVKRVVCDPLPSGADFIFSIGFFNSAAAKSFANCVIGATKSGKTQPLLKRVVACVSQRVKGANVPLKAALICVGENRQNDDVHVWINKDPGNSYGWHTNLCWRNWGVLDEDQPVPTPVQKNKTPDIDPDKVNGHHWFEYFRRADGLHLTFPNGRNKIILTKPNPVKVSAFVLASANNLPKEAFKIWEKLLEHEYNFPKKLTRARKQVEDAVQEWHEEVVESRKESLIFEVEQACKYFTDEEITTWVKEVYVRKVMEG